MAIGREAGKSSALLGRVSKGTTKGYVRRRGGGYRLQRAGNYACCGQQGGAYKAK